MGTGEYITDVLTTSKETRKMLIGKTFKFDSAHFLPGHPKCGATHGHTWFVEVMIKGWLNPDTGMVVDLHEFSDDVNRIIEGLDHTLINNKIKDIPTCENIALFIKNMLNIDYEVHSVKVQEGTGGFAIA